MENYVVIAILVVIAAVGVKLTLKHFRGQGGCCGGGGDYKLKKKKLDHVQYQKTFRIDGMQCEHCKRRVEEAVNDLRGVAGVVNLKTGVLTVSYAQDVSDGQIREKVERAGYHVIG